MTWCLFFHRFVYPGGIRPDAVAVERFHRSCRGGFSVNKMLPRLERPVLSSRRTLFMSSGEESDTLGQIRLAISRIAAFRGTRIRCITPEISQENLQRWPSATRPFVSTDLTWNVICKCRTNVKQILDPVQYSNFCYNASHAKSDSERFLLSESAIFSLTTCIQC